MDKKNDLNLDYIIKNTQIVQMPKYLLATFAETNIDYYFVSSIHEQSVRLRHGTITAEKPAIIHSRMNERILEGFDEETQELIDQIEEKLGSNLRMLGYHFKNTPVSNSIKHLPLADIVEQLKSDLRGKPRTAIVKGIDQLWQVGLIKLIIEDTARSFPSNVQELEERGFFPGSDGVQQRLHWQIGQLFKRAHENPEIIRQLGSFLKKHNLFHQYEDRFFSLVKKNST